MGLSKYNKWIRFFENVCGDRKTHSVDARVHVCLIVVSCLVCGVSQSELISESSISKESSAGVMMEASSHSEILSFNWPASASAKVLEQHGNEGVSYNITVVKTDTGDLELTISNLQVLGRAGIGSGPPPGMVSGFVVSAVGDYIGPMSKGCC